MVPLAEGKTFVVEEGRTTREGTEVAETSGKLYYWRERGHSIRERGHIFVGDFEDDFGWRATSLFTEYVRIPYQIYTEWD